MFNINIANNLSISESFGGQHGAHTFPGINYVTLDITECSVTLFEPRAHETLGDSVILTTLPKNFFIDKFGVPVSESCISFDEEITDYLYALVRNTHVGLMTYEMIRDSIVKIRGLHKIVLDENTEAFVFCHSDYVFYIVNKNHRAYILKQSLQLNAEIVKCFTTFYDEYIEDIENPNA